ncbi:hypothetical protein [Sphingobacterium nematocida]|uniref:hypothetical protein n=1 Tax=Sphingobacterium nematocida TaxID=1513896 RepID=UPI001FEB328E|nr:hypothetical protein [Sphingobacterium nematocida]
MKVGNDGDRKGVDKIQDIVATLAAEYTIFMLDNYNVKSFIDLFCSLQVAGNFVFFNDDGHLGRKEIFATIRYGYNSRG